MTAKEEMEKKGLCLKGLLMDALQLFEDLRRNEF
jgi:hypothetical protein